MIPSIYLDDERFEAVNRLVAQIAEAQRHGKADHFWPEGAPSSAASYRTGFMGEAGFAQWVGQPYKPKLYQGGDGGVDIVVGKERVQVKSSRHPKPGLMFDSAEHFRPTATVAVLMRLNALDEREQWILGWVRRETYLSRATVTIKNPQRPKKLWMAAFDLAAPERIPHAT